MSNALHPELFPVALGNEEESMLLTGPDMAHLGDPEEFVEVFAKYLPANIASVGEEYELRARFIQNGGRIYDGGAVKETNQKRVTVNGVNLERTTPECSTPKEVAVYTESNERLYVKMLEDYVENWAEAGDPRVARAQRRVISTNLQTRASHDNIEIRRQKWWDGQQESSLAIRALHTYLASRSFITGAGYVNKVGSYYAQKVQGLEALTGYGRYNTAYRMSASDTGPRLEVRCNDINISPWAIQARIGGAALFTTLLQTKAAKAVEAFMPAIDNDGDIFGMYRRYNIAPVNPDGELFVTRAVQQAVDFQDRIWEFFDEEMADLIDIPEDYQTLIHEVRYYIEDFRKVARGDASLAELADRSDVAAKFSVLFSRWQKNAQQSHERPLADIGSMANDLKYDMITIEPSSAGRARTTYGFGMRLRNQGKFRLPLKPTDVERAYLLPPPDTRAKIRGDMIRRGELSTASWRAVKFINDFETTGLGDVMPAIKPA